MEGWKEGVSGMPGMMRTAHCALRQAKEN